MFTLVVRDANAQTVKLSVFNTGVNNANQVLPGGAVDPHWTLQGGGAIIATDIVGDYVPNDSVSRWLSVDANALDDDPAGLYIYATTFSLAGLNPSSARISGQFASDNGSVIFLNGVSTGITDANQFHSYTPFSITSGFVPGVNTLEARVTNSPGATGTHSAGPVGFRAAISGATATVAPEAGTLALLLPALGVLGAVVARRRP